MSTGLTSIIDPSCHTKALIVTFLPANSVEGNTRYDIAYDLGEKNAWIRIPREGELFCWGFGYWCVRQVIHSWGQHEHVISMTVSQVGNPSELQPHALKLGDMVPMG